MTVRDVALCAVAAVALVVLAVVASIDPPAADSIITGIVAIGAGALGRLSGATGSPSPSPSPSPSSSEQTDV